MPHAENPRNPRHILLLTDRDWTHPQGGGTGTNLYGQVSRWVAWGHRVTVIAGSYPGAEAISRPHERLTIHRMGGRTTWENILTACAPCSMKKGGRTPDQARMALVVKPIRPTSWQLQERGKGFPPNYLHAT